jgi:hypothetical protein
MSLQIQFIFSTNLEYESGDQVGSFDKKTRDKNLMHVYVPLRKSGRMERLICKNKNISKFFFFN